MIVSVVLQIVTDMVHGLSLDDITEYYAKPLLGRLWQEHDVPIVLPLVTIVTPIYEVAP
ncbi:MAG: hypothetical protein ABSF91_11740 [Bacteroidota bacterium]|jgi:hypothetical protein